MHIYYYAGSDLPLLLELSRGFCGAQMPAQTYSLAQGPHVALSPPLSPSVQPLATPTTPAHLGPLSPEHSPPRALRGSSPASTLLSAPASPLYPAPASVSFTPAGPCALVCFPVHHRAPRLEQGLRVPLRGQRGTGPGRSALAAGGDGLREQGPMGRVGSPEGLRVPRCEFSRTLLASCISGVWRLAPACPSAACLHSQRTRAHCALRVAVSLAAACREGPPGLDPSCPRRGTTGDGQGDSGTGASVRHALPGPGHAGEPVLEGQRRALGAVGLISAAGAQCLVHLRVQP